VRLFELAYGCRLYGCLTGFDDTLNQLRHRTAPALDPRRAEHRAALFEWLNSWGCRQFAKEHHATTASDSLVRWADAWLERLPAPAAHLTELSVPELEQALHAYDALRVSVASQRHLGADASADVTYGPTGAAKTLFALRPNVFPPWDDPIRVHGGYGAGAAGLLAYLLDVARSLRELSAEAGVPVSDLPGLVGRPGSSPPKLIDEYHWVVVTRGCPPPTPDEIAQWARWASSD